MTRHPSADSVIQQLRAAFPGDVTHRYLILDNDAILSDEVSRSIAGFGLHPKRTAFRSPWQNGTAGRFVGSVRVELLDHVVVLGEEHLKRLLGEYIDYYNAERVHTSIGDAPAGRACEPKPSRLSKVVGFPRVGHLHHRYAWRDAARWAACRSRSAHQRTRMGIEYRQRFTGHERRAKTTRKQPRSPPSGLSEPG